MSVVENIISQLLALPNTIPPLAIMDPYSETMTKINSFFLKLLLDVVFYHSN